MEIDENLLDHLTYAVTRYCRMDVDGSYSLQHGFDLVIQHLVSVGYGDLTIEKIYCYLHKLKRRGIRFKERGDSVKKIN